MVDARQELNLGEPCPRASSGALPLSTWRPASLALRATSGPAATGSRGTHTVPAPLQCRQATSFSGAPGSRTRRSLRSHADRAPDARWLPAPADGPGGHPRRCPARPSPQSLRYRRAVVHYGAHAPPRRLGSLLADVAGPSWLARGPTAPAPRGSWSPSTPTAGRRSALAAPALASWSAPSTRRGHLRRWCRPRSGARGATWALATGSHHLVAHL